MPKVLLVGASSQICGGWLTHSLVLGEYEIFYLSRNADVGNLERKGYLGTLLSNQLADKSFDLVVNFVGASNHKMISDAPAELNQAMGLSDQIALSLAIQGSHYLYLSSGAVYKDLPGDGAPPSLWNPTSFYAEEKLRAELRHAEMSKTIRVADLRVFGYLDKPNGALPGSLIGDLWSAFESGEAATLNPDGVLRDIAGPQEIAMALDAIVEGVATGFFDLYTQSPAGSVELAKGLGLEIEYLPDSNLALSPTGPKKSYFSTSRTLGSLGYAPGRSTLEVVTEAFWRSKGS